MTAIVQKGTGIDCPIYVTISHYVLALQRGKCKPSKYLKHTGFYILEDYLSTEAYKRVHFF